MKKILSIFLAVLMLAGLCAVTAFADFTIGETDGWNASELVAPNNSASADVQINLSGTVVNKYAIDIVFGDLKFSYGATSTWDPTNHTYKVSENGKWAPISDGADKITIKNHSDKAVVYEATNSALNTLYGNLGLTIQNSASAATGEIEACSVGATNETVPSDVLTVAVTGTPSGLTNDYVTLSTITVTITPKA